MRDGTDAFPSRARLEPRLVTANEFCACTPEKLELIDGEIIGAEPLLMLLLASIGLRRALELVGRDAWLDAAREG